MKKSRRRREMIRESKRGECTQSHLNEARTGDCTDTLRNFSCPGLGSIWSVHVLRHVSF